MTTRIHLTASELCSVSGLSLDDLERLEDAGLLRPTLTDPEPVYRFKLTSWAEKLNYLLRQGWTLDEITLWSQQRWYTANPREWPPSRPGR